MTKYGNTTEMQKLAWGQAKSTLPDIVTAVQNQVTTLINLSLNKREDYGTVPEFIDQIANTVGSDILISHSPRNTPLTTPQILDMVKVLTMSYMDQAPVEDEVQWGNTTWFF